METVLSKLSITNSFWITPQLFFKALKKVVASCVTNDQDFFFRQAMSKEGAITCQNLRVEHQKTR